MLFDFFNLLALVSLLIGVPLLHSGLKIWRTNTERSWLVWGFALLFIAVATLLLLVVPVFLFGACS